LDSCERIGDENFINYCYAIKQKTSIACFEIKNPDLEFLCYSHVQNTNRFCADVRDAELNQLCLGLHDAARLPPRAPR
jgi:hypothetical protein